MNQDPTLFERFNQWTRSSISLKLLTVGILMLLLLIPSSMIRSIIGERENLNWQATQEVSAKWANGQQITGPVLSVPVIYISEQGAKLVETKKLVHILPETLEVSGDISPERLRRGIYEVVVYRSQVELSGSFKLAPGLDPASFRKIFWDQAFLTIGLSDLRGIKEQVMVEWDGQALPAEPGSRIPIMISSGITIDLPALEEGGENGLVAFQLSLNFQGSQHLSFVPVGSTTDVRISSSWPSPSFNGNFLPDDREVSDDGFLAQWRVLKLNRNFPQNWVENAYAVELTDAAFGVELMLPLDDYQKSMRSAKYAVLTIALTFLIFFLVEVLTGRRIHPFQYILVGLALCLFYVLLISLSEHLDFNIAYLISTTAIVSMISLYSTSVFKVGKYTLILLGMLIGLYGFLFVTLQLTDYALLIGSLGLLAFLATTMYFTRNIDWYGTGSA